MSNDAPSGSSPSHRSPSDGDDQRSVGLPSGFLQGGLLSLPVALVLFGAIWLVELLIDPSLVPSVTTQSDRSAKTAGGNTKANGNETTGGEMSGRADPPVVSSKSVGGDLQTMPASPEGGIDTGTAITRVTPDTPWKRMPANSVLTRIGIGSCLSQRHPQPIWDGVLGLPKQPDLFLMVGDNVYGDIKSPDGAELISAYEMQAAHPEFSKARQTLPMLATWDDHDYGINDGGAAFEHRVLAAKLFRDFWQIDTGRPVDAGLYYARTFGPVGRRVQMIFLDTRFFRGALTRKTAAFPHWGRYEPSRDASQTLLGDAQWAWLSDQLRQPADVRVIVSSIQVLAEGHGFERWGNLPHEQDRLIRVIEEAEARGVVFVSGDRHAGALYALRQDQGSLSVPATLAELTSSSLNRSYGPSKDAAFDVRLSDVFHQENFGLIDIDWGQRKLTLSLRGMAGELLTDAGFSFDELGISR